MRSTINVMNRRDFVRMSALAGLAGWGMAPLVHGAEETHSRRQFKICLAGGPIGLPNDPRKLIAWADRFGFEAIEPSGPFLAKLSDVELRSYLDEMKAKHLAWGAAGLPVQFRGDESTFEKSMEALPAFAQALQRAGVTRVATWLTPGHKSLTYLANFRLHARRLRAVARALGDHGLRLGLEYVGPKTSWSAHRFPFIHTMAEMKELIAEIGCENVGFLLDSWHWYTAHETAADLLSLRAQDVVLCHLNDAPKGIPVDQQIDSHRELPCATGVIDLKAFLGAMIRIGYDGSVVCEPFSQTLRNLSPEQVLASVATALKKAVALCDG